MATVQITPPRLRQDDDPAEVRHATWIELFFDVIFAVTIAQIAGRLEAGIAATRVLGFIALFLPVWWSWIGTTFYATRFIATDDLLYRFTTVVQMCAVAGMAVAVRDGFGARAPIFAAGYAVVRAVLVLQYLRAARHVREARPLAVRYARGFGSAAALWLISVAVPAPYRFALWGAGLAVDIGTPIFASRPHHETAPDDSHLPERFGQFTLIVLGETVALAIVGASQETLTLTADIIGPLAIGTAFSLAWLYFENLDGSAIRAARAEGRTAVYRIWLYAHFPLVVALTLAGTAVQYAIRHEPPAATGGLLCGSIALSLLMLGVIHWASAAPRSRARDHARARLRVFTALGIGVLAPFIAHLHAVAIMAILASICVGQVVFDLVHVNDAHLSDTPHAAHGEE
jgi:low temperature requirement protein LtrA